jgi:DNA-directed RNA polymerase subunit H
MEPLSEKNLLQIKQESLKLLKERGYVIPAEEAPILTGDISESEFKNLYLSLQNDSSHPLYSYFTRRNHIRCFMSNIYYKKDESCLVFFAYPEENKSKKISNDQVAEFCRAIIETKVNAAIMVCNVPSSSSTESICSNVSKSNKSIFIQYFMDEELMYNPIDHVLVPKHRLLSEAEIRELVEVDKIGLNKIPKISTLDPVCKRMAAKQGDVVEVTRKVMIENQLIDEEISYRFVFAPRLEKSRK